MAIFGRTEVSKRIMMIMESITLIINESMSFYCYKFVLNEERR
jgi:hypothetical protein